jgi:hypothetical protein
MPLYQQERPTMKVIAALIVAVCVTAAPSADAATCAEGARGAACAGPNGAAAVRRPTVGSAVVHPATPYHRPTGAVVTPHAACAKGVYRAGCVAR